MAAADNYAAALRYGPQTQGLMRRSQYLADALKVMGESGGKNIQSGGELAAKLLATALLQRSSEKARGATTEAIRADMQSESERLLAGLGNLTQPTPQAPLAPSEPPVVAAAPSPAPVSVSGLPDAAPAPEAASGGFSPVGSLQDMARALRGMVGDVKVTSGLRSPAHNARVGGAKNSYHLKGQALDLVPPAGMDMDGLAQALRRSGQPFKELLNEGDHVHVAWDGQGQAGGALQPIPPNYAQPLQPPGGMTPSAPSAAIPAQVGTAPAASPQAAAGATTLPPTQQEILRARQLLSDPRTFEAGKAYAMELQQRAVTPMKTETVTINGLPFQRNPYTGETTPIAVPEAARTQLLAAQQAGLPFAPQGLYVQRDPLGNVKEAPGAPPQGYNAGPEGYRPIQGGPSDPNAPQRPAQGYINQGDGSQTFIRGGPADPYTAQRPAAGYEFQGGRQVPIAGSEADPRNVNNVLSGTKQFRDEIAPVVQDALKLRRNIEAVRVGHAQQNGVGDIAIINGIQRMIDDGVVREGDVALQLKAQGLAGTLSGLRGFVESQGPFQDPKIRDALLTTANALYGQVNEGFRNRVVGYRPIVDEAYGPGTFEKFVFTPQTAEGLGWTGQGGKPPPAPRAPATPAPTPGTRAAAIEEARKRGIIK